MDNKSNVRRSLVPTNDSPDSIWYSKRFLVAVVMFLCYVNSAMQIQNVNIAVVEMTSNKTIAVSGNETVVRVAEFQWDTVTIGTVSSILWYGGLFAFTAGFFVDKFGGSGTCVISMMICGVLTILLPVILKNDYFGFLMCRFITGFFLNLFYASTSEVYSRWYPKKERSTLIAIGCNGANFGTAIAFPLFGFIAAEWGWQMVFYVSGVISIIISLLCLIIVRNRPSQDGLITEAELSYILEETDDASRNKMHHPYKQILSSGPVYAVCFGKFTLLWITTILTACLPLYVKDLTGRETGEIGLISSIPTIAQIFMIPFVGLLLDRWKNTTSIKLTLMHKITVGLAYLASSLLFGIVVLASDFTTSMIIFVFMQIITSIVSVVIEPIIVGLSPNDSSVVSGLSKFLGCTAVIISRTCVGFLTINHSPLEWNNCFLLTIGVLIFGTVIFIVFGSSEAQPWSSVSSDQERARLVKIKYRRRKSSTNSF
ncbi:vesicular glutamate transporter 3-like [Planococcus citri]|uniref:vesicular glutamate transporter 3-like n=1 Tax=Planococcus citri TaxID=170843 RepID=UPI0031FA45AA